jgi:DNA-binding LytR/AlgR family response regulator
MKNILIVEDEGFALQDLRDSVLELVPSLLVTTARTAQEAIELLQQFYFDAVFLDIELPGMTGIELLRRLHPPVPPVILCTAHALTALDAFGLGVVECLLKPIDQDRLRRVVEMIINQEIDAAQAVDVLPELAERPSTKTFLLLREGAQVWIVKIDDILRLEAAGESTRVFFQDGGGEAPHPLAYYDERLDGRKFFRINDQHIIRLDAVDQIVSAPAGGLLARFPGGLELAFAPDRAREFAAQHAV